MHQRFEYRDRTETTTDEEQLGGSAHFTNDLGLDSLDTVEVVMAIEEVGIEGVGSVGYMV